MDLGKVEYLDMATRALYGYTGDEKYLTHNSRMCLQIIENFK